MREVVVGGEVYERGEDRRVDVEELERLVTRGGSKRRLLWLRRGSAALEDGAGTRAVGRRHRGRMWGEGTENGRTCVIAVRYGVCDMRY